jgi:hypothetical protein
MRPSKGTPLKLLRLIQCLCLLLFAAPASGWNRAGHMVCGAFVGTLLERDNPQALADWTVVLKRHPQYESHWREGVERAAPENRKQSVWMLAARWPDDIRSDPQFDRPEWHYINHPYKPAGQPQSVTTVGPADVNIVTAFRTNIEILKGTAADAEKAVALCWVLHLVGDVHQPLHTTRLFTQDFPPPSGDRGGTLFYIRATADAEAISLHKFWDDLILGTEDFRAARNEAIRIRTAHPPSVLVELARRPAESDFRAWAEVEGSTLARSNVYLEGRLAGSASSDSPPVLPRGYANDAKRTAEHRLALAAHRLARLIAVLPRP